MKRYVGLVIFFASQIIGSDLFFDEEKDRLGQVLAPIKIKTPTAPMSAPLSPGIVTRRTTEYALYVASLNTCQCQKSCPRCAQAKG